VSPLVRAIGAVAVAVTLALLEVASALAAAPSASPLAGDPRSAGEGPGLVGEPLLAIGAVVAIAAVAVVGTLLWIRATAPPPDGGAQRRR
jgi:hypothetical protein